MQNKHFTKQSGFTLIELLVVIVIVGLLSAVATTSYLNAQKRARDNTRKTDLHAIATAVESYYAVKKSFPGGISSTVSAPASLVNCENTDAQKNFFYYYFPLTTATGCNQRTTTYPSGATTSDFAPFPNWIPGLSEYINPIPVDKYYQGSNGGATSAYSPVESATEATATTKTNTYVYRHLNGGYAIYTRLENPDVNEANIVSGTTITDQPTLGSSWSITGKNVYMLRK